MVGGDSVDYTYVHDMVSALLLLLFICLFCLVEIGFHAGQASLELLVLPSPYIPSVAIAGTGLHTQGVIPLAF